jgi:DNA-binding response OmpR family regulator
VNARLLIVDDDRELCELLEDFLQLEGFDTRAIHDGSEAVQWCSQNSVDAIILDIMLPGMQGLDVLRKLREQGNTPVLMLTARGEDTDRIVGLEMGADDYLPKPCNPRELAARLRAILRRTDTVGSSSDASGVLSAGELWLSRAERRASYANQDLTLTSAEFNLLRCLLEHAGEAVDKDNLCQRALGRPLSPYDRSVDVHISKLRRKLAELGAEQLIVNIRGVGYQLAVAGS